MSLKYALLGLLAERPKYGYEIKRGFEGALGNVWSMSYGQLYPTLRRLSELNWVTKKTEPGKKAA
jgi:PadR family transcriptional regulator AphA